MIPDPGKANAFDRYAYVLNNPIRYNDPTGHDAGCGGRDCSEYNDVPISSEGSSYKESYRAAKPKDTLSTILINTFSYELQNLDEAYLIDDPEFQEAMITAAYKWYWSYSDYRFGSAHQGPSENSIFNWLGEAMESAKRRSKIGSDFSVPDVPKVQKLAAKMANKILTGNKPDHIYYSDPIRWANRYYVDFVAGEEGGYFIGALYTLHDETGQTGPDDWLLYTLEADKTLRKESPFDN